MTQRVTHRPQAPAHAVPSQPATEAAAPTRNTPPAQPAPPAAAPAETPAAPARSAQSEHAAVRDGAQSRRSMGEVSAGMRASQVEGGTAAASAPALEDVRAGRAEIVRGQSGPAVGAVQEHLNRAGTTSPRDGRLGPATERAVQQFQGDRGLPVTGRVDASTLGALEGHASPVLAEAGRRETDINRAERAAHTMYEAHRRDDPVRLSDRSAVEDLIRHTPQLDGDRRTVTDRSTCGGAAMLNGLLLDGDSAHNGAAISTVAERMTRETPPLSAVTGPERTALDSMTAGHLTPTEANHLQGLLTRMGDHLSPADSDGGTTAAEMAGVMARVRTAGGFPNTAEMTMRIERVSAGGVGGPDGYHFTVSSRTRDGHAASADSWPNEDGSASLTTGGSTGPRFTPGSRPPSDFEGEVTLRDEGGLAGVTTGYISGIHNADGHAPGPTSGFVGATRTEGGAARGVSRDLLFTEDGVPVPTR